MICRNWIGAAAVGLAANAAYADISMVQVGLNAGDLSADGNKVVGSIYHYPTENYVTLWQRGVGGATTFPGSYPQSASIRASSDMSVFAIDGDNTDNWANINCFIGNTNVPQVTDCGAIRYTPHIWTQNTGWTNAGWLPRAQIPNQTYTDGTFNVWVGGTRCDFSTGSIADVSGDGRYVLASGWSASAAPKTDGSCPSGICGPYTIGRFDRQTNSWLNLGLSAPGSQYSRGDRINGDGSTIVGYNYGVTADPDGAGPLTSYTGRRLCVWYNGVDTLLNPYGNNDDAPTNSIGNVVAGDGNRTYTIVNYNNAPVAVNDTYSVRRNQLLDIPRRGVLANDTDKSGSEVSGDLTAVNISNPSSGTLFANADGSFQFLPANNFTGNVTFTYQAKDIAGALSNVATVTITVVNTTQPFAIPDYVGVAKGGTLIAGPAQDYSVLMNDQNGAETAELVTNVSHGVLTFNSDGTFTYIPAQGFFGYDSFTYRCKNAGGTPSAPVTVSITVIWQECGARLMKWTRSGSTWSAINLGSMPDSVRTFYDGNGNPYQSNASAVKYYPTAVSDDGNTIIGAVVWSFDCSTFSGVWHGFIWQPSLNGGVPMDFEDYLRTFDTPGNPVLAPGVSIGYPTAMSSDGTTFLASISGGTPGCLAGTGGDVVISTTSKPCEPPRLNHISPDSDVDCVPSSYGFIFNIFVSGTNPLTYQWQRENPNNPGSWDDIFEDPNCTSYSQSSFSFIGTSGPQLRIGGNPDLAGHYRCIVTNSCGSLTSPTVTLTRPPAPANDICSTATAVGLGEFPFNLCTARVNEAVFVPCVTGNTAGDGGSDLWWQFVPPITGTVTIESCEGESTALDTNVAVFPDCSYFPTLACSDNNCPSGMGAKITGLAVEAGVPLIIRVGKRDQFGNTQPGAGVLKILSEGPICVSDVDGTPGVGVSDLFYFLDNWFAEFGAGCSSGCVSDLDGTPSVGVSDLFFFLDAWFAEFAAGCGS